MPCTYIKICRFSKGSQNAYIKSQSKLQQGC